MASDRAEAIQDRLGELARERGEYEVNHRKYDPQDLRLSLLRIRKQELQAMRELREADPSFRPQDVADGITRIQNEIANLKQASGLA